MKRSPGQILGIDWPERELIRRSEQTQSDAWVVARPASNSFILLQLNLKVDSQFIDKTLFLEQMADLQGICW